MCLRKRIATIAFVAIHLAACAPDDQAELPVGDEAESLVVGDVRLDPEEHRVSVGDTVGKNLWGHDTMFEITMDEMVSHARAVKRGAPTAFLVGDMPFMSYTNPGQALDNSVRLMQEGGAMMIKLEGGEGQVEIVEHLARHDIPVCAHLGLKPQSVHKIGGFRVQGREAEKAKEMKRAAKRLQDAGADIVSVRSRLAPHAAALGYLTIGLEGLGDPADVGVLCPSTRQDCSNDIARDVVIQADGNILVDFHGRSAHAQENDRSELIVDFGADNHLHTSSYAFHQHTAKPFDAPKVLIGASERVVIADSNDHALHLGFVHRFGGDHFGRHRIADFGGPGNRFAGRSAYFEFGDLQARRPQQVFGIRFENPPGFSRRIQSITNRRFQHG